MEWDRGRVGAVDQNVESIGSISRHEEALETERHVDGDLLVWLDSRQSLGWNLKVGLDLRDHLAILAGQDHLDLVLPTNLGPMKHDPHREGSPERGWKLRTVDARDPAAQDVEQVLADGHRVAE